VSAAVGTDIQKFISLKAKRMILDILSTVGGYFFRYWRGQKRLKH
jgi:hypothetical protein